MDVFLVWFVLKLVWFVAYMASIYLFLHIVCARLIRNPDSRVLWFFSVVTGPLTRPVRGLLPPGAPEPRVRWVALGLCVAVLVAARVVARLAGVDLG
jgi:uncharacterized protein YggT (Ycf19 family)